MGEAGRETSVLVLAHSAGPAAGAMEPLRSGTTNLGGEANSAVVTAIDGADSGDERTVTVAPGAGRVLLDGAPVSRPVEWPAGAVLRVGNDAWTLIDTRADSRTLRDETPLHASRVADTPTASTAGPVLWSCLAVGALGVVLAVTVASAFWLLVAAAGGAMLWFWWRGQQLAAKETENHQRQLASARARLVDDVERRRRTLIAAERTRTPRGREVAVGLGDCDWTPEVMHGPHTGWDPQPLIGEAGPLSSIPVMVDLDAGPVALVGDPDTTVAVARSIALDLTRRGAVTGVFGPAGSRWRWLVALDGFTSDPSDLDRSSTLVFAEQLPESDRPDGPTVVLVRDLPASATERFATVVRLDADATGSVWRDGAEEARALIPIGRSEAEVLGLPVRPLRPGADAGDERGLLLFSAPRLDGANELLASLVVDLARRSSAADLAVFLIDEVRQPLVRLRQAPHVRRYASLNDLDDVVATLTAASRHGGPEQVVVAVADLPELDFHLRRRGHRAAAELFVRLAAGTDHRSLTVAGSAATGAPLHPTLTAAIGPRVEQVNGTAVVTDDRGTRTIELARPSARDLTMAVAGLRRAADPAVPGTGSAA